MSDNPIREAIQQAIADNETILFMKGTPDMPRCGFSAKTVAVLDQLGTPFDTRIVAANGKVDVLYNGEKKAELPLSGSGWYWKVGAYVQSNGSTGDGAGSTGEVVVYKADISHSGASASDRG